MTPDPARFPRDFRRVAPLWRRLGLVLLAASVLVTAWSSPAAADDPVSSNVRFNREIIRILQRRCLACHTPGGVGVSLTTYRDVRDWGRAIREEVVEQRMPPVSAPPGSGLFQDPLGLTARETTTLLAWIDGGMPRGDERDLPASIEPVAEDSSRGSGDLRIELPGQQVPALEALVVRRVTIDPKLTADRLVTRVDVRPGSRSLLRGAFLYQGRGEESWIGAWLPWQHTVVAPASRAFKLAKGVPLTVVLYYRGGDEAAVDRSAVELHFADDGREPVESLNVVTTTGRTGRMTLQADATIWAALPLVAASTQSLELRAERPDGSVEMLLWIPTARPEWPTVLVLREPVTLPGGTVLTLSTLGGDAPRGADRVLLSAWSESRRSR
jgi:hypothetical protein